MKYLIAPEPKNRKAAMICELQVLKGFGPALRRADAEDAGEEKSIDDK